MEVTYYTLIAAILCLISLGVMLLSAAVKFRREQASPKGNVASGIIYAFTAGLLPGAKESASRHLLSYTAGIVFHIGIFCAFLFSAAVYLMAKGFIPALPQSVRLIVAGLIGLGLVNGVGLLIKRVANSRLRFISTADDYFSNIIVNIFLLLAVILAAHQTEAIFYALYIFEAFIFLYIPLGKLRHCAYFIATRIMFGYFYGYRGVLPALNNKYQDER